MHCRGDNYDDDCDDSRMSHNPILNSVLVVDVGRNPDTKRGVDESSRRVVQLLLSQPLPEES
jgi:hypothetical protein